MIDERFEITVATRGSMRRHLLLLLLLLPLVSQAGSLKIGRSFTLDDYFNVQRVSELAISSDGQMIAYVVERSSLQANALQKAVYIQGTWPSAKAREVKELKNAHQVDWIPNSKKLAFLSAASSVDQIFVYNTITSQVTQLSHEKRGVLRFKFSPSREGAVAYLSSVPNDEPDNPRKDYDHGIEIDTDRMGYSELAALSKAAIDPEQVAQLFLVLPNTSPLHIKAPGEVLDFFWWSDNRRISITYVDGNLPKSVLKSSLTSLGLFEVGSKAFTVFAEARPRTNGVAGAFYWGGEWVPNTNKVVVRKATEANMWIGDAPYPAVAIVDTSTQWNESIGPWANIELYPRGSKVLPATPSKIFIETRSRARDALFSLRDGQIARSAIKLQGNNSQFQFSSDFKALAFVNESMVKPPEVYFKRGNQPARRLSSLNEQVAELQLPRSSEIAWKSSDGVEISGWLLSPDTSKYPPPWPLLTYVHGGPGYAYPDQFLPAISNWPHPLEVLAARGIAILIPQYRGTFSFGREFATPHRLDEEPIADITSGIDGLVLKGIADAAALGIAGHSHGSWLGPMVAVRTKRFRAASFAEGWSNHLTLYELYEGEFNREIQEIGMHEPSLYKDPQRYIKLSPDLHFEGLNTALLFEAGAESTVMHMLGMPKAARFFGIQSDFIVYPRTGHTLTVPRLQRESAERNLDWFLFWLKGERDGTQAKAAQYRRWEEKRNGTRPSDPNRYSE